MAKAFGIVFIALLLLATWWEFRYEPTPQEKAWEEAHRKRDEAESARRKAEIEQQWSEWADRVKGGPNYYPTPKGGRTQ